MIAKEIPIDLEVLDAIDSALASVAATLRHLEGERATLTIASDTPAPCLHWGSRVRFRFGDGAFGCEVVGMVIAHSLPGRQASVSLEAPQEPTPREVLLRLWEC